MGAQESALRGGGGRGGGAATAKASTVEMGEEYPRSAAAYRLWSHIHPATRGAKRAPATVFIRDFSAADSEARKHFENGVKCVKQLRHPCILSFLHSDSSEQRVMVVTERVQLLDQCIDSLSPVEIHSGLRAVAEALVFLHHTARLSHNNLSPACVFVTSVGEWRLGGFELTQPLNGEKPLVRTEFYKQAGNKEFWPPEDQQLQSRSQPPSARDAFAFGKLIVYALEYMVDIVDASTVSLLGDLATHLTASEPAERGELFSLLSHPALSNPLSEMCDFLQQVHIREDEDEKREFFRSLPSRLRSLSPRVVARRLARPLLSRYVMLEEAAHLWLYPVLLTPMMSALDLAAVDAPSLDEDGRGEEGEREGILPLELYTQHLVPELVRVFSVRDSLVRCRLLSQLPVFLPHLPADTVEGVVLHEVTVGARDSDARVCAASLHAMAELVGVLGVDKVIGAASRGGGSSGKLRVESNFSDGTPKNRLPPSHPLSPASSAASLPLSPHDSPLRVAHSSMSTTVAAAAVGGAAISMLRIRDDMVVSSGGSRAASPEYNSGRGEEKGVEEEEREQEQEESRVDTAPEYDAIAPAESGWGDEDDWSTEWEASAEKEEEEEREGEEEQEKEQEKEQQQPSTSGAGEERRPMRLAAFKRPDPRREEKKEWGAEFAVPVVKTADPVDDLFADMAPEIKTSGTLIDQLLARQKEREEEEERAASEKEECKPAAAVTSQLFQAVAMDDMTDAGDAWGDDDLNLDDD